MKRLLFLIFALCMLLCACAGAPDETTVPPETTAPVAVALPAETEPPVETTEPPFASYTIRVEDPETPVYAGPSFRCGIASLVGEAGTYTIVEESLDMDGNRWGRLKSGAGWLCLTEDPNAPILADYAPEDFNAYHAYWSEDTDYITAIGFTPTQTLTQVRFGLLDWFETESWQMTEVLYTIDEMAPDHAFLAHVAFWGDMTTYGISFTDENGESRHYAISISGKDGSLVCTEYLPA